MKNVNWSSWAMAGVLAGLLTALVGVAGCAAQGDEPPASAGSVTLLGTFSGDYGFGLDPASAEALAQQLSPGEQVVVVADGERTPLGSVRWAELRDRSGRYAIEARGARGARPLGDLHVLPGGEPQCEAAGEQRAAAEPVELMSRPTAALDADAPEALAACSHNSTRWTCINCQCRSGIAVKGYSQRSICIYGSWYAEQLYRCDCSFVANICNIQT